MSYTITTDVRENQGVRASFNALAEKTFGLNFESWYQNGFWGDDYRPYSMLSEGEVKANVSANVIRCAVNGEKRTYIQLGTVMTAKEHRNKGLCRALMQRVLSDYVESDGIFLYANDSVTDFYPKFGFKKADEYVCSARLENTGLPETAKQLPMQTASDWAHFLAVKNARASNGYVKTDCDGLLMFYMSAFMRENAYLAGDTLVIAEKDGDTLVLYDVFSKEPVDIIGVARAFGKEISTLELRFTPERCAGFTFDELREPDTTLFVLGDKLPRDLTRFKRFPEIIRA